MAIKSAKSLQGAALVEFALVAGLFFFLVLAGVEAGRYILELSRSVEATRAGVRAAVVHTPPANCLQVSPCAPEANHPVLLAMQRQQPRVRAEQVSIHYAATSAGSPQRPSPVPIVTVRLHDLRYEPMFPLFLGMEEGIPMPAFPSSLLGESLHSLPHME